jgi:hypothetical protein
MNTVECPKCALHFEPDEEQSAARAEIFCPQCGNEFSAGAGVSSDDNSAASFQTA